MAYGLGVLHACALLGGAGFAVRRYEGGWGHKVGAGFLLVWGNLALTGLLLSTAGRLNQLSLYLSVSCALCALTAALPLLRKGKLPASAPGRFAPPAARPLHWTPILVLALLAVALAFAASAVIASCSYPNNYDTIAYRFPRVFLYLGQGHLGHPQAGHDIDLRLAYYPLNLVLGYVFLAMHGFGGLFFNLPSLASWVLSGLGIFLLGRAIGGSREGSLLAAAVYLLSPVVLACATSTSDEVLAATPLLFGVLFLHRWWHTGARCDALLAGLGIGLGGGAKLHWLFFAAFVPVALLVLCWRTSRSGNLRPWLRARFGHLALIALISLSLTLPFVLANYRGSGHLLNHPSITTRVRNQPFHPRVALINLQIFTAQLLLSPIPDVLVSPNRGNVVESYRHFNEWLNPAFAWFDATDRYGAFDCYTFKGVTGYGFMYNEASLWLGFTPYLLLLAICTLAFVRKQRPPSIALWLALGFFFWHAFVAAALRYFDSAGVYYSYPLTLAAASLAVLWDVGGRVRLIRLAFLFVLVTHILTAINIFCFNSERNLLQITRAGFQPRDIPMDAELVAALRSASDLELVYTEWELQMFHLMNKNPRARYAAVQGTEPLRPGALRLFCLPRYTGHGGLIALPLQGHAESRLRPLGSMTTLYGVENVFAAGSARCLGDTDFIVLRATPGARSGLAWCGSVAFDPVVFGLANGEALEVRLQQILPGGAGTVLVADWQDVRALSAKSWPILPASERGLLWIEARSAGEPGSYGEVFYPLFDCALPDCRSMPNGLMPRFDQIRIDQLAEGTVWGFGQVEGPYPPDLPLSVRWLTSPVGRIQFRADRETEAPVTLCYRASFNIARIVIRLNGGTVLDRSGPFAAGMHNYRTLLGRLNRGLNLLEIETVAASSSTAAGTSGLRILFEDLHMEALQPGASEGGEPPPGSVVGAGDSSAPGD